MVLKLSSNGTLIPSSLDRSRTTLLRAKLHESEGNIITEGNISPNPPSGGSINDILYRKSKTSVRINFYTFFKLNLPS